MVLGWLENRVAKMLKVKTLNSIIIGLVCLLFLLSPVFSFAADTQLELLISPFLPPSNLTATVVGHYQIDLNWSVVSIAVSYKVYRDSILIASPTITGYSDTGLTAGKTYSYAVSSINADGAESSQSSPVSVTIPTGGGGLPSGAYNPPTSPKEGFGILINDDAEETNSRNVSLTLRGGPNTKRMVISNSSDFSKIMAMTGQINYQSSYDWDLCRGLDSCIEGAYTAYVKFYTQYGYSSEIVSDSIIYTPKESKLPTGQEKERPIVEVPEIIKKIIEVIKKIPEIIKKIPESIEIPKIIKVPEVVKVPKIIKVPETPVILSKEVLTQWPTGGIPDAVTGITGLVSWSVSALTQIVPALPELPQTIDEAPTFSGVSSIPYALIFLEIHSAPIITGKTRADENGYWTWTCPEPIPLGTHTLEVTAQAPEDVSKKVVISQKFEVVAKEYVEEIKEKTLFDVVLIVRTEYKKVYPGDDLLIQAIIIKFEPKGRIDIPLHWQIRDEKEEIILDHTETMAIETQLSFIKNFHITEEAKVGKYAIFLEIPYNDTFVHSSDTFEIIKRPIFIIPGKIILTTKEFLKGILWIFVIFLLMFVIFIWALRREYRQSKRRGVTPRYLNNQHFTKPH